MLNYCIKLVQRAYYDVINLPRSGAEMPPFEPFEKINRLYRDVIITEKIDGTNAQIYISDDGSRIIAGSRNRWLTPDDDNYGFARWVNANKTELLKLGPGRHYGEWWGSGIGRKYGKKDKVFSLFNTWRWLEKDVPPLCCSVVPIVSQGIFSEQLVRGAIAHLAENGSVAAPGFSNPEGIVIFHIASGSMYKVTLKDDNKPKCNVAPP